VAVAAAAAVSYAVNSLTKKKHKILNDRSLNWLSEENTKDKKEKTFIEQFIKQKTRKLNC